MWSSRLFWKLFLVGAGLNLTLAIGFSIVAARWQKTQVLAEVQQRLHGTAIVVGNVVREHLESGSPGDLKRIIDQLATDTGLRLTLIDPHGKVLADSEKNPRRMENHLDRAELAEALTDGLGVSTRESPTLGISMFYLAVPVKIGDRTAALARVSTSIEKVYEQIYAIQRLLWTFALLVGLMAVALTYAVVRRIIRPLTQLTRGAQAIAAGDYEHRVAVASRDELGTLGAAFNHMQEVLVKQLHELRQNGERLATVLGSMVEGVIAVDSSERILLANDASKQLLGFVTPEVDGRPLREVTRSRTVHEAVSAALNRAEPCQSEFQVPNPNRRVLALRAGRLPGIPCPGVVVVLHDVSELRRLENLRSEFVANVSHELKTPLASIKAYAETLRLGAVNDPENNLEFVCRIEEQAERLHQLILDLLSLARVESGQEVFEIADVPIAEVIQSCVDQHLDAATSKQIRLETVPCARPLLVRADEEGVRTILDNLVDNAIKYTPAGGCITIRWWSENALAVLEVTDTGIGIAPHDQARVFERFYRADRARSRELGGTGLGLSIIKHLALAFGGGVHLTSTLGVGSTFQVRLPLST